MSGVREKIADFRPSKMVLFWSCAGTAVATMVIGFTWGGWVTAGAATDMAETGVQEARASLAADICVERFLRSPDARVNLAALGEESAYSRDNFIADAGWVTFGDTEDPVDGAADLCAEQLAEIDVSDLPPVSEPVAVEADAGAQIDSSRVATPVETEADPT